MEIIIASEITKTLKYKLWGSHLQRGNVRTTHYDIQSVIYGTKYSRMDQVKFVEDSLLKIWRDIVCLIRPCPFKFFKGCL